ncbi:MAG: LacI family DNA-binding transcriptional regulator [Cellulosilyticaceae bacterium]
MRKKKKVTLDHIAEKSGLSKVTVSKALNNKDGVSEEVKLKVREVAEEIGYKFTAVRSQDKSKHIGIILHQKYIADKGNSTFYLKFYQELAVKLNQEGYICNLFTITPEEDLKKQLPPMFSEVPLCGIISIGDMNRAYIELLIGTQIPIVFLDCYHADCKIDCIATDNYYSTYDITGHLIESGHQKIGFVGVTQAAAIQDRLLGYCRALMESGIPIDENYMVIDRDEENNELDLKLPKEMPTAFVCNGDDTAYKFVQVLKAKGYSVPEDVSIVGFDNDIYAEICTPQLTTVAVDREAMTNKAIKVLVDKMERKIPLQKNYTVFVPGDIIYRNSVKKIK